MSSHEKLKQDDDIILHFVLDGVCYALRQNVFTQEEAYERMKRWFPDAQVVADSYGGLEHLHDVGPDGSAAAWHFNQF